jgi:hypothetical protein
LSLKRRGKSLQSGDYKTKAILHRIELNRNTEMMGKKKSSQQMHKYEE